MNKPPGWMRLAMGLIPEQSHYSVAANLRAMAALADKAGKAHADLVAFEEGGLSLFGPAGRSAVTVPGPETRRLGAIARRHQMYIAATLMQKLTDGKRANAVVLLNRQGNIEHIYHKQQLTDPEIRNGVMPGDKAIPVTTDFGRVGFLICYDTQFPELARVLGVRGADLVICPHVGGAGPHRGRVIGSADAYRNGYWLAWVGRFAMSVIDPSGEKVAELNKAGRLLVTDIDLRRPLVNVFAQEEPILDWRSLQLQQRRPQDYRQAVPTVILDSPDMPLYTGNPLKPGTFTLRLRLRNLTDQRQRGTLGAEFPVRARNRSNDSQPYRIDWTVDQAWRVSPRMSDFDLKPRGTGSLTWRVVIPDLTPGYYLGRISGDTRDGERLFWQRQFHLMPEPPNLVIPHLKARSAVRQLGALLPLAQDFCGGPAHSRTVVRIGWTTGGLTIHARAHRFGPWSSPREKDAECLTFAFAPEPRKPYLYWLTLYRDGRRTTQRREHGSPVTGGAPLWRATIRRHAQFWETTIVIPFGTRVPRPRAGSQWGFNLERHALLPQHLDAERGQVAVRTPKSAAVARTVARACEWATWNPTWSRIDNARAFGNVRFSS